MLNSYSSIYKQQREHSKSSARDEIVTSERYKEKDVVNQVPVTTLRNSSSMGEVKNKHKQFKQNQMKQTKNASTTRGVSYRIDPNRPVTNRSN